MLVIAVFAMLLAIVLARAEEGHTNAIFSLRLTRAQREMLDETLFEQVSNPKHARYGQYLSNADLRKMLGASPMVLQKVQRFLRKRGFQNIRVTEHGDHIRAFGPVLNELPPHVHSMHFEVDSSKPRKTLGVSRRMAIRKMYAASKTRQGSLGDPNSQRQSYGIPSSQVCSNPSTTALVWGPGTYGYLPSDLSQFYNEFSVNAQVSNINTTGYQGVPGGDNFGECTLDVSYSTGIGNGVYLMVSNTNTSGSTEEGNGFGYAFYDFALTLSAMPQVPGVVSLSLGSLSAYSCNTLCQKASSEYGIDLNDCNSYLQQQRQICMMDSMDQQAAIGVQLAKAGSRGTTIVAAAGDGGSHFSFTMFNDDHIGRALNKVSCAYNFPTFPASSPYVTAVGGTQWSGAPSPSQPIAWTSGGSGFSWQFSTPPYQKAQVQAYLAAQNGTQGFPAPGSFRPDGRAYPDCAALADNIPMVEQGSTIAEGGTSGRQPD